MTTSWWDGPIQNAEIAVVDLEMTGLDPLVDEIVEIAVQRMTAQGQLLDRFETTLRIAGTVGTRAFELHGLSAEQLETSPRFGDVIDRVVPLLTNAAMVGHGITLDLQFLERALHGVNNAATLLLHPLDTAILARRMCCAPSYALSTLCTHLGLAPRRWHRAGEDVWAVCDLWNRIVPAFDPPSLADLSLVRVGQNTHVEIRPSIEATIVRALASREKIMVHHRQPGRESASILGQIEWYEAPMLCVMVTSGGSLRRRVMRADRILRISKPENHVSHKR